MCFSLFAKYVEILGGTQQAESLGLTRWQLFSFFRYDLLLGFVAPLLLIFLSRYISRGARLPTAILLALGLSLLLYVQVRAFQEIGRFISWGMLLVAIHWGAREPRASVGYLGAAGLLAFLLTVASIVEIALWAAKQERKKTSGASPKTRQAITAYSALALLLLVSGLSWLPALPRTPYHEAVLVKAFEALWAAEVSDTREFDHLTSAELKSRYRELTNAPSAQRDVRYWEKAEGANVLFFVFETAPARFLPAEDSWDQFPNLKRLRERSFVGASHYSTYPNTCRAVLSLFSSWYPSEALIGRAERDPNMAIPGIMHSLSAQGYATGTYSPFRWRVEPVEALFRSVGFRQQSYADDSEAFPSLRTGTSRQDIQSRRMALDLAALHLLKQDLERHLVDERRFAVAFLPEIGHIPFADADENTGERDLKQRAREVLAKQDAWLGELLELLKKHHQLERTVIVITGDHGVRTRQEDPQFRGGMIDEYSFHVPLLIYAPQALTHTETIAWVTSHIDVAPTVLDLLGVENGRAFEEGTAIWNPNLARRTTFFFAFQTLGADGYHRNGQFFMRNNMFGSIYASRLPHFDTASPLPPGSTAALEASRLLDRMIGFQEVWTRDFSLGGTIGDPH